MTLVTPRVWRWPDTAMIGTGSSRSHGVSMAISPSTARSSSRRGTCPADRADGDGSRRVEEAFLKEAILDPAQHQRRIAFADFGHQNPMVKLR